MKAMYLLLIGCLIHLIVTHSLPKSLLEPSKQQSMLPVSKQSLSDWECHPQVRAVAEKYIRLCAQLLKPIDVTQKCIDVYLGQYDPHVLWDVLVSRIPVQYSIYPDLEYRCVVVKENYQKDKWYYLVWITGQSSSIQNTTSFKMQKPSKSIQTSLNSCSPTILTYAVNAISTCESATNNTVTARTCLRSRMDSQDKNNRWNLIISTETFYLFPWRVNYCEEILTHYGKNLWYYYVYLTRTVEPTR